MRLVVGGEAGYQVGGLEQHPGDVVGQQLDLLVRVVDGHLVHPLEVRHRGVEHVQAHGAAFPAALLAGFVRRGERLEALPVRQVAHRRVGGDQVVQVRGAAAGQPADDDRPLDRDGADLRMRGDQGLQPQPVDQIAHQLLEHHADAGVGQSGFGAQRAAQHLQAGAEVHRTPAAQSGALRCRSHQRVRCQVHGGAIGGQAVPDRPGGLRIDRVGQIVDVHRLRAYGAHAEISRSFTTRQAGRSGVCAGRNHRSQISPVRRPAVDTQLGCPGSASLTTICQEPSGW